MLRRLLFAFLLAALAAPAFGQDVSGRGEDPPMTDPPGEDLVTKKGDKLTRKDKRERKRLKEEQEEARKQQKKWEKMGLAARTAPEWYSEALQRYKAGKYLQAREILLPLEDSPRAVDIQDKVKLLIADTYYYQGGSLNLAEALARYRTYLTFYPNTEHSEYARFQMGNCYYKQLGPADRDQSFTDNAIAEYEALIRDYPSGEFAGPARDRMLEAKALRARHEFEVAEFYRSWGNHEAAAERLEDLLHDRPESPDREAALYLAADSLYQIGRPADAAGYAARLREDYPGSKYLSRIHESSAGAAAAKLAKKSRKREKEEARTYRSQRKREERSTRQVRKDAGLPARVPGYENEPVYAGPVSDEAALSSSASRSGEKADKREERMMREEEREQEKRARELEREAARRERDAARAAEPKSAKELEKERKRAEKEAREAEKHAERMEKAEAREQEEAARKAEKERARAEKKAEKEAKKAEKKAKKSGN